MGERTEEDWKRLRDEVRASRIGAWQHFFKGYDRALTNAINYLRRAGLEDAASVVQREQDRFLLDRLRGVRQYVDGVIHQCRDDDKETLVAKLQETLDLIGVSDNPTRPPDAAHAAHDESEA